MTLLLHRILLAVVAAVLVGCQTVYEDKYDWKDGWRRGLVIDVGAADQLGDRRFRDCRPQSANDERQQLKFVVVSFVHAGRPRHAVVPVAPSAPWRLNSPVYVNVFDCSAVVHTRAS